MLHLFECARQQQELEEQRAECAQYEQQLAVLNQQEQDYGRERGQLGYTLRMYYEAEHRKQQEQARLSAEKLTHVYEKITEEEEKAEKYRAKILEQSTAVGSVQAKIQEYDAKEETYNRRYQQGLIRNILGEYEPAALEIRLQE